MTFRLLNITFGTIDFWTWILVFSATLLYEYLTVVCVMAIIKFRSIAVANISVGINAIGIGCVLAYTQEVNTTIPLLAAVWAGNYYAVEHERRKAIKSSKKKIKNKVLTLQSNKKQQKRWKN